MLWLLLLGDPAPCAEPVFPLSPVVAPAREAVGVPTDAHVWTYARAVPTSKDLFALPAGRRIATSTVIVFDNGPLGVWTEHVPAEPLPPLTRLNALELTTFTTGATVSSTRPAPPRVVGSAPVTAEVQCQTQRGVRLSVDVDDAVVLLVARRGAQVVGVGPPSDFVVWAAEGAIDVTALDVAGHASASVAYTLEAAESASGCATTGAPGPLVLLLLLVAGWWRAHTGRSRSSASSPNRPSTSSR
jgi:hypothetical protein